MSTRHPDKGGSGLPGPVSKNLVQVRIGSAQRFVDQEGETIPAGRSLFGEVLEILGDTGGALLPVRTCLDGYESLVRQRDVSFELIEPTHYISVPHTNARLEPIAQSVRCMRLGMMSPVRVIGRESKYVHAEGAGWVPFRHVREIGDYETDYVKVALRFIGTPYDLGERDGIELDCSSLIQTSLAATGRHAQRTAGEQARTVGSLMPLDTTLRYGDFVFWVAHVGMMLDSERILHACEDAGEVTIEYLKDVIARRREEEPENKREITAIRRILDFEPS